MNPSQNFFVASATFAVGQVLRARHAAMSRSAVVLIGTAAEQAGQRHGGQPQQRGRMGIRLPVWRPSGSYRMDRQQPPGQDPAQGQGLWEAHRVRHPADCVVQKADGCGATGHGPDLPAGDDWPAAAEGLRKALINSRNEIQPQPWKTNYQPCIEEALRILSSQRPATDGHGLLQRTLEKWQGKPVCRAACCVAVRKLTEQAIARHHAPACWSITPAIVKDLRGKAPIRRTKASLVEGEILYLIEGIERRNPGWANVLRTLPLFGLRPIELQHLTPKRDEHGTLPLWRSYRKRWATPPTGGPLR